MTHRFQKHYTREEARRLLPKLRQWLEQLAVLRVDLQKSDRRIEGLMASGQDAGGQLINKSIKMLSEIKMLLDEFQSREIQVKDIERGLIDFPALIGGKEVFLCWEKSEDDVEHWHDIDSGFAGREPL